METAHAFAQSKISPKVIELCQKKDETSFIHVACDFSREVKLSERLALINAGLEIIPNIFGKGEAVLVGTLDKNAVLPDFQKFDFLRGICTLDESPSAITCWSVKAKFPETGLVTMETIFDLVEQAHEKLLRASEIKIIEKDSTALQIEAKANTDFSAILGDVGSFFIVPHSVKEVSSSTLITAEPLSGVVFQFPIVRSV